MHVVAKIDPFDLDYYGDEIEPLFRGNNVRFCGEIEERHKPIFYAGATATLFPSDVVYQSVCLANTAKFARDSA